MKFKPGDKVKCVERVQLPHDSQNYAEEELKIDSTYLVDIARAAEDNQCYKKDTLLLKNKKYEHDVANFVKVTKKSNKKVTKNN